MLSIGKLAADQATYYLDQAETRVDVVTSVGEGLEEYYVGAHEARGTWIGAGSCELGLGGAVERDELRAVLAGLHPRTGELLRTSSRRASVAGFDLTFSAPKSVSVLFGIGDTELRGQVREAHDAAVLEAIGYLERSAAAVRRGHAGAIVEHASGVVAAAFRHRTSRAGDPQLHTHVLVANLGCGLDGRWSALDGRRLYAHARTASFLYQAVLRAELTRRVGLEWAPVTRGIAEVIGVPRKVARAFSRRRADIEAALDERRLTGARAAEAAALATRTTKGPAMAETELVAAWRSRAAALGFGREELALVLDLGDALNVEPDWCAVWDQLAGPLGLTRRSPTFDRGDVLQALCEAIPPGATLDAATLERAADRFLAERAVALLPEAETRETGEAFRRRDGRLMPAGTDRLRYSTPEHLALERRLVERAVELRGVGAGRADFEAVEAAFASRPTLSNDQRRVVESLTLDGDGVAVVAGRAGTGKTFALGAAREAWQASGFPVFGVAVARRAASELQDGAGIASTSVAALLGDLGPAGQLPDRCVLVVDEAAMVPTRQLAELVGHVEQARGKLVLVGDEGQLPELAAGGGFRALVHRRLAVELSTNVRQVQAWEREALEHLRAGRAESALSIYRGHDALVMAPTEQAARQQLVSDWLQAGDPDSCVMIAHRRVDVGDLNARGRARLRESGAIQGRELDLPGGRFAVGDRVVIKRNDLRIDVQNGQRARVVAVDQTAGALTLTCGSRTVDLDRHFLHGVTEGGDPTLLHGYAITGHVAQGLTVDRAFVLAGDGINREWAYVALSRGRLGNRLYAAILPEDPREEFAPGPPKRRDPYQRLVAALTDSAAQVLAIDSGAPEPAEARRELDLARRDRAALESRHFGWLPGRRDVLEQARERERAAAARLVAADRSLAERAHAGRPFVTEADVETARARRVQQRAERRTERLLERDLGREL